MNRILIVFFILVSIQNYAQNIKHIHTTKYPFLDNKEVGFGTDKDSINYLTAIRYADLIDSNRSYYYIKDQILFDSLVLQFYCDKLIVYYGYTYSDEKALKLYQLLCADFKNNKNNSAKDFRIANKNYYLQLNYDYDKKVYLFLFQEQNMYDAFIFHCKRHSRFHSWNRLFKNSYERKREQKIVSIKKILCI